ncbi:MAG TPA: HAMP domain-containing sensor histidine kinase [Candidatus Paceibacterota bacterium]|nr:HAMP domain-containing sensor histidine kinase [Candidatus Paceibacterota bacterium]HPT18249.1 HAMP domain-containing sensor histidine kinase [Candidatus Paceibacterota bacterium]
MGKDDLIKSLQEKNDRLEKLCLAKTDIVSISAHQIRTSLSASRWIIKMFLDGDLGELTAEQENLMKRAYEDNVRAIEIVSELLLANKTEDTEEKKYNLEEFDIIELINDSIFDFSGETYSHEEEIIFLKPETKFPMIYADKEKIRIVLQNLIENAIKYSNKKGKIFIAIKEENGFAEVSIKDTGIGISEEGKAKIFERFYRDPEAKKKEATGTGIGLFTTKKIIENHNGKIWFESKQNQGTTFFFTIPQKSAQIPCTNTL